MMTVIIIIIIINCNNWRTCKLHYILITTVICTRYTIPTIIYNNPLTWIIGCIIYTKLGQFRRYRLKDSWSGNLYRANRQRSSTLCFITIGGLKTSKNWIIITLYRTMYCITESIVIRWNHFLMYLLYYHEDWSDAIFFHSSVNSLFSTVYMHNDNWSMSSYSTNMVHLFTVYWYNMKEILKGNMQWIEFTDTRRAIFQCKRCTITIKNSLWNVFKYIHCKLEVAIRYTVYVLDIECQWVRGCRV